MNGSSNFFDSVCSFKDSAISFIESLRSLNLINNEIASKAKLLINLLHPVLIILKKIGEYFGVLKPEDDIEEMGAKATKSDKNVDDFDNVEEYMNHLRNDIELDENEMKNLTDEEKTAYKAVGATITNKGIEEKVGMEIPISFWNEVEKYSMSFDEVKSIIDSFKNYGLELSSIQKYLNNELEEYKDRKETGAALCEAYKNSNPEMSMEDIEDKVLGLKNKN